MIESVRAVTGAVRGAAVEARRSWSDRSAAALVAFLLAAALPLVISNAAREAAVAARLYLALAAIALNVTVGLGGLPSLGQGAFVGVGSFTASLLLVRAGWGIPTAVAVAGLAAGLAGVIVGTAAVRLRGPFVAVVTWVVSWVVSLALGAFTGVFGGSQGLALPSAPVSLPLAGGRFRMTAGVHYEAALVLVALALWAFARLARSPLGVELAAVRTSPPAATTLGVDARRLQLQAFVATATIGGVAGALSAHLAGVADPTAYGPLLSVELFVAVLLGGVGRTYGPLIGTAILAAIPTVAARLGSAAGLGPERFEPVLASVLLLAAVIIGPGGLTSALGRARPRRRAAAAPVRDLDLRSPRPSPPAGAVLTASSLRKRFGGVSAVDGVDLTVEGGTIHAVIGPNGSGKTTLLRLLSGTLALDDGRLSVAGSDLTSTDVRARVRAGVVRTIARTTVFDQLTAAEHVTVGMATDRRYAGFVRTLAATPLSRAEAAALDRRARELLAVGGLEPVADVEASTLSGAEQRVLMVLTAYAADPAVMLVDEPSTGLSGPDADRMAALLNDIRAAGVTLLVVEHNLQLVRRLADPVTVLDAGKVIAEGAPADVALDPAVQDAYLGPGAAELLAGPRPATEYRVAPRPSGGWVVQRSGASRPSSRHETKAAAVRRARDLAARHAPARMVVLRKDGSVERTSTVEREG